MSKDHDQISLSESGGNPKVRLETSPAMPHAHDPKRRRRRSRLGDPGLHSVYVFHRTASHKQGIVRHWSTTKRELGEKSPSSMDREHSYRLDLKKSANPGSCTDGATVIKNLRADLATGSVNLPCEIIPDKPARTGSPRDYFPRICEHYSVARLPGRTRVSSQKGRILQAVKPDQSHGGRFTIHVDLTGTPRKHDRNSLPLWRRHGLLRDAFSWRTNRVDALRDRLHVYRGATKPNERERADLELGAYM